MRTIKVAISTPETEREINDIVARRHNMNRSEFYTRAAANYRDYLSNAAQIQADAINEIIAQVGQPDSSDITANSDHILDQVEW